MFITRNHREEVPSSFFVMLTRTTMDLADWGRALLLGALTISVPLRLVLDGPIASTARAR
jgi:hypothetical protein